ncbi:MAG: lipocalin-like domain-containing protein [Microvirga sp.]
MAARQPKTTLNPVKCVNLIASSRSFSGTSKSGPSSGDIRRCVTILAGQGDAVEVALLAYSATYTLERDKIVHHVDAAWKPAWVGTDLTRPFTFDGDTLVISGAPSKDPATGEVVIYRIEFTKVR